ncbi:MAG TPA: zinc ribbon domain-containing protein [Streptosporangiaceae bacterium]|nr:zinc ribbon domain-containing protein [Streptosporangiaceae bacterium]
MLQAVKAKLTLAERNWTCKGCGALHDRDVNAAINLARPNEHAPGVEGRPAGSGPVAGRRAIRKTSSPWGAVAGGSEASTPQSGPPAAGQTRTAPPQGEAA